MAEGARCSGSGGVARWDEQRERAAAGGLIGGGRRVRISRKAILGEMVKSLGGSEPRYSNCFGQRGFVATVEVMFPSLGSGTEWHVAKACGYGANTVNDAEESAAVLMIEKVKAAENIEVDDMNWIGRVNGEERILYLRKKLAGVTEEKCAAVNKCNLALKGWSETLKVLTSVEDVCEDFCCAAAGRMLENGLDLSWSTALQDTHCLREWIEEHERESTAALYKTMNM